MKNETLPETRIGVSRSFDDIHVEEFAFVSPHVLALGIV